MTHYGAGPKAVTAGQRTMSGLIVDLTGPTLAGLMAGHFWIRTFCNIFHKLSLSAFCSITLCSDFLFLWLFFFFAALL